MGQVIFWNISIAFFLWIVVHVINVKNVKSMPSQDFTIGYKDIGMKKGHLTCQCGKLEKMREKDLDIKTAQKLFREVSKDKDFLEKINNFQEVKEFADCLRCNLTYINCAEELCVKKAIKFSLENNTNQTGTTVSSMLNSVTTLNSTVIKHNSTGATAKTSNEGNKYNVSMTEKTSNENGTKYNATKTPAESTTPAHITNLNETMDHVNDSKTNEKIPPGFVPKIIDIPIVNDSKTNEKIPPGFVPKIIDIPIGGHKNHSRSPRYIGCSYPSAMETAAISCRVYPSSIKCIQKCAFGYTLENGIRKDMQCKFKENRWVPSGFKECVPFVDCTVTLSSGGSATCSTASVDKAPVCKIECLPYEDKPEVPMALYACKADGSWEPKLPFCAIPGSGLMLAPPPRVKTHNQEDQPKKSAKD